jgi:dihydropteroate synthase
MTDAAASPPVGLPDALGSLQRCLVMSVVNVTPDSFSDGGEYLDPELAVQRGVEQGEAGADLVDVGGESTRPGAERVPLEVELNRVLPVVSGLAKRGALVSIDTMRAEVARRAVDAGAVLVNDVSGGLADPDMLPFLASTTVPCVLMHWRGHSVDMQTRSSYPRGAVTEVREELASRLVAAADAGLDADRIVLDPGLGFAKESEHNWELLRDMDTLRGLGRPLLVGASRKRFLGSLLADDRGRPRELAGRDDATAAVTAIAASRGAWCVRVHDSRANADAVRVAAAWSEASS